MSLIEDISQIKFEDYTQLEHQKINFDDHANIDYNNEVTEKVKYVPYEHAETELKEEIKQFRDKNKEFQATNDHETYLIVCFSTKEDKQEFLNNTGLNTHTIVDGYELARSFDISPKEPKFKLKSPLNKRR